MRRFLLGLCVAAVLPLAACDTLNTGQVPAPSSVANASKLDEQAAVTAHLGYKAFRIAVETGIGAGLIKGELAGRIATVDNQLYSALQAVDAAYATGNAASFDAALRNFNSTLALANSATGRK